METYCANCKENTGSKNSSVRRSKQNRSMIVSSWAVCGKKKAGFIKNQEFH